MRTKLNFKKIAAVCAVAAGCMGVPALVSGDEFVRVIGEDNSVKGFYPASSVSYIEFAEVETIEIPLSDDVKFTMVKVEGGVPYTLTNGEEALTEGAWANGGATKQMQDFWIGKFEVTQAVWKKVMGISNDELPVSSNKSVPQSAIGDDYPIANVSFNEIAGFLAQLNAQLESLKEKYPEFREAWDKAGLGNKEFRLPNEWEWEYAAAGGKNYTSLNYHYSGTTGDTSEALETVAVNSVSNTAKSVDRVGSKAPNVLGLYDMTGNVWEQLSCLGYPGHENNTGFLRANGEWESSWLQTRGGSWAVTDPLYFGISFRSNYNTSADYKDRANGFRLAL